MSLTTSFQRHREPIIVDLRKSRRRPNKAVSSCSSRRSPHLRLPGFRRWDHHRYGYNRAASSLAVPADQLFTSIVPCLSCWCSYLGVVSELADRSARPKRDVFHSHWSQGLAWMPQQTIARAI